MKILVFPHAMELGGSQLNAIEIGAAVRDIGHEVAIVSEDGPLVDRVHALGLRHHRLVEKTGIRPSWRVVRQLKSLVRTEKYEVVHGYEWPPVIEAALGPGRLGAAVVGTVMSMSVAPFLPHAMPLIVGTQQIGGEARTAGFKNVTVLEPPVDTRLNAPGAVPPLDVSAFGVCPGALVAVSVSRLAIELKLEGLLSACDAVAALNQEGMHLHLLIVGDGPAREQVAGAAAAANAAAGHPVVHMLGSLDDPRPAYTAGDILIGMGGSAIRCLAFAKPLIVQGERGFWRTVRPGNVETFLEHGWFGLGDLGDGRVEGAHRLRAELCTLTDSAERKRLGDWSRTLATQRFGLDSAGALQEQVYRDSLLDATRLRRAETIAAGGRAIVHAQLRRIMSKAGFGPRDDFNSIAKGKPTPAT